MSNFTAVRIGDLTAGRNINFGWSPEEAWQFVLKIRQANEAIDNAVPPGLITGPDDNRLLPREGVLFGRSCEVKRVLTFLHGSMSSTVVSAEVAGVGGIGKTEVCKAALRLWMADRPPTDAYYVEIPSDATPSELINRIGRALSKEVDGLGGLLKVLPSGLYYIDNLESVAETSEGHAVLRTLIAKSGVRLLVSSRFSLKGILGASILIDALPREDALELFRKCWPNANKLPGDDELAEFAMGRLGGHALSITLTSRLGDSYTYLDLVKRWDDEGTALSQSLGGDSRLDSLAVSLSISAKALTGREGALSLWTTIGLFGGRVSNSLLSELESNGGWSSARRWLVGHHLIFRQEDNWHMLPPVARFALDASRGGAPGFDWFTARKAARPALDARAVEASRIETTVTAKRAGNWLTENFDTWARYVKLELSSSGPDIEWLQVMSSRLKNLYQYRPVAARSLLRDSLMPNLPNKQLLTLCLGDLEVQLGDFATARKYLESALRTARAGEKCSRIGWALRSLGNLAWREGNHDDALEYFREALEMFEEGRTDVGFANLLVFMGSIERRQGNYERATELLTSAVRQFGELNESLGHANALIQFALIEIYLDRFDGARRFLLDAIKLFQDEPQGRGYPTALKYLGDLEFKGGRYDEAKNFYDEAQSLYRKVDSKQGTSNILGRLGSICFQLNDLQGARSFFDRSLELLGEDDRLDRPNVLVRLAKLEVKLKAFPAGWALFDEAVLLFNSIKEWPDVVTTCLECAELMNAHHDANGRDRLLGEASGAAAKCGSNHFREMVQKAASTMGAKVTAAG